MTNKKNYESIMSQGVLKMSDEIVEGVFTIELTNFFKRWRSHKSWQNVWGDSLQEALLEHTANGSDEIVMLKIPTVNINTSKLAIRSQNTFFSWFKENDSNIRKFKSKIDTKSATEDEVIRNYIGTIAKNTKEGKMMLGEIPAYLNKHYMQKKQALEYVYKDNIPVSQIEKLGEVNIAELRQTAKYDPIKPMRSIFTALLKDTPECKAAELLNC
jgi:hypothetical protein